jgi:Acetyltransferases, including N-acetylases of ribosomal proteins
MYRHASRRHSATIDEETTYVTWSPHAHANESASVIDQFRDAWEARESATYAVVPGADEEDAGAFAGNTGVGFKWERQMAGLGIWLRKPFWGRRYSGERAEGLATLAFERLGVEMLAVTVVPANENSIRAVDRYIDRLGGRREGRLRNYATTQDGEVYDVVRFTLSRDEFLQRASKPSVTMRETLDESQLATSDHT